MAKKLLLIVLVALGMASCKENTYVLTHDQMVDVLVDMHLAEGMINASNSQLREKETKLEVYNFVFDKHNITKARLDSSIRYYSVYAPEYYAIYEEVAERINQMESDVSKGLYQSSREFNFTEIEGLIQNIDRRERDSIVTELWRLPRSYVLPEDGAHSTIHFEFPNDTTHAFDFIVLKTDMTLSTEDKSVNPRTELAVQYTDGTEDKIEHVLYKTNAEKKIRIRLAVDSTKVVNKIYGDILQHDECPEDKVAKVFQIRLYKMHYPSQR